MLSFPTSLKYKTNVKTVTQYFLRVLSVVKKSMCDDVGVYVSLIANTNC